MGDNFRYVYILYLRREDAILANLCMGLPITATVAAEWLLSLILHSYIYVYIHTITHREINFEDLLGFHWTAMYYHKASRN